MIYTPHPRPGYLKVELATAIEASSKSIKIVEFAKVISSQSGFVIGRNNLFA
jgi:phage antirepressor YoqD-like protein